MIKIEITLNELTILENKKVNVSAIETYVKSKGFKPTEAEIKLHEEIVELIEAL